LDWKDYEREILEHFQAEYPSAQITSNARLFGKFSKIDRQIDLLIQEHASDFSLCIVVDAKHRSARIDVNDVEAFLGLLRDVGADIGVLISPEGYSQAAINRAHYDDSRLEVDVLNFKELSLFQSPGGVLAYSGDCGVALPPPFGWIVDANRKPGWVASLYQRGLSLEGALKGPEMMYINFWHKDENISNLDGLLKHQESYMLRKDRPDAELKYVDAVKRTDGANTTIRAFKTNKYPVPEYTGFVEFDRFIFFCVLLTPVELEEKNLRKLRYVMRRVLPFKVNQK
jgi:hypothetical protein